MKKEYISPVTMTIFMQNDSEFLVASVPGKPKEDEFGNAEVDLDEAGVEDGEDW